jgi:hypothetical protein
LRGRRLPGQLGELCFRVGDRAFVAGDTRVQRCQAAVDPCDIDLGIDPLIHPLGEFTAPPALAGLVIGADL